MPLVQISISKGGPADFGKRIGTVVCQTMLDTINVPVYAKFQVISGAIMRQPLICRLMFRDVQFTSIFLTSVVAS